MITNYEGRIRRLESQKLALAEQVAKAGTGQAAGPFEQTVRTALTFLANPLKLWDSERLEDKRAVLKLAFKRRLEYLRNQGFRTADLSLPFKILEEFSINESQMAGQEGESSNRPENVDLQEVFATLTEWDAYLREYAPSFQGDAPLFLGAAPEEVAP